MEDWKLSQLKAHQQFTLGRIDGLRWVLDRSDILSTDEGGGDKEMISERLKDLEATDRECQSLIQKILDKREEEKQQRLADQQETHKRFGEG